MDVHPNDIPPTDDHIRRGAALYETGAALADFKTVFSSEMTLEQVLLLWAAAKVICAQRERDAQRHAATRGFPRF